VSLVEGGTLGLELLSYVWDCSRLIVIDAVDVGEAPGTVVRMSGEELNSLPGNSSVHQLGVSDLLVALRVLAQAAACGRAAGRTACHYGLEH